MICLRKCVFVYSSGQSIWRLKAANIHAPRACTWTGSNPPFRVKYSRSLKYCCGVVHPKNSTGISGRLNWLNCAISSGSRPRMSKLSRIAICSKSSSSSLSTYISSGIFGLPLVAFVPPDAFVGPVDFVAPVALFGSSEVTDFWDLVLFEGGSPSLSLSFGSARPRINRLVILLQLVFVHFQFCHCAFNFYFRVQFKCKRCRFYKVKI